MKKFLIIALIALSSCSTARFTMGMSEQDFLKQNRGATLVEARGNAVAIYRLHTHNGRGVDTKFFYFSKGFLIGVDHGTPAPDIKIDETIHHD